MGSVGGSHQRGLALGLRGRCQRGFGRGDILLLLYASYYGENCHWTMNGHVKVAGLLAELLADSNSHSRPDVSFPASAKGKN